MTFFQIDCFSVTRGKVLHVVNYCDSRLLENISHSRIGRGKNQDEAR